MKYENIIAEGRKLNAVIDETIDAYNALTDEDSEAQKLILEKAIREYIAKAVTLQEEYSYCTIRIEAEAKGYSAANHAAIYYMIHVPAVSFKDNVASRTVKDKPISLLKFYKSTLEATEADAGKAKLAKAKASLKIDELRTAITKAADMASLDETNEIVKASLKEIKAAIVGCLGPFGFRDIKVPSSAARFALAVGLKHDRKAARVTEISKEAAASIIFTIAHCMICGKDIPIINVTEAKRQEREIRREQRKAEKAIEAERKAREAEAKRQKAKAKAEAESGASRKEEIEKAKADDAKAQRIHREQMMKAKAEAEAEAKAEAEVA